MLTVSEEIDRAHYFGKTLGRHRQASNAMLSIAVRPDVDSQARADCFQQAGVYALNAGRLRRGREYLEKARNLATNDESRGNIMRDLARYFQLRRDYVNAGVCCREALRHHGGSEGAIMDRSFLGRILFAQGSQSFIREDRAGLRSDGLAYMLEADHDLSARKGTDDDRRLELYNKLHLASALSRVGSPETRQMLDKCAELAQIYGNWQHRLRVTALITGGWRGEWVTMKLLKSAQRVRNLVIRFKR